MQSFARKNIWTMHCYRIIIKFQLSMEKEQVRLRQGIQQYLKKHSRVKSYRFGEAGRRRPWCNSRRAKVNILALIIILKIIRFPFETFTDYPYRKE